MAREFFFAETMTGTLGSKCFEANKRNLSVASLLDRGLFKGEQLLDDEELSWMPKYIRNMEVSLNKLAGTKITKSQQKKDQSFFKSRSEDRKIQMEEEDRKMEEQEEEESSETDELNLAETEKVLKTNDKLKGEAEGPIEELYSKLMSDLEKSQIMDKKAVEGLSEMPFDKARKTINAAISSYSRLANKRTQEDFNSLKEEDSYAELSEQLQKVFSE